MPDIQSPEPRRVTTVNPASGAPGESYPGHSIAAALEIAAAVAKTQGAWRFTAVAERAAAMRRVAEIIGNNAERYNSLMRAEMGKCVSEGRAELAKCQMLCRYFADHTEALLAPRVQDMAPFQDGPGVVPKAYVTYDPLGVVLAVMPWNFPFWQAMRAVVPHIMAGNGVVLKHASNVPGCALAFEEIFRLSGFPVDLVRTVLIGSSDVKTLIESPDIAAVTLTGSVGAGRAVAAVAGGVLKKCVLELGGSDAYLVLEDADIDHATKVCAQSRMVNAGQACDGAKRFIVVESVREVFEAALVREMSAWVMGDPADPTTKLGPLESVASRDAIAAQVDESVARGARVLLGGVVPDRPGAWYPATILTDVIKGQPSHDDEVFGPVAAVISAKDADDAVRIANDSRFGLGGAVFTRDLVRGEEIAARRLDCGSAVVNRNVRSSPALPFGGVKDSGYGRELSDYGIHEFCNIKTVLVQP